ncbi:hypothetical protein TNCV_855381 [Trichonephila clavipes]|nr:hypothetical protein TNCV_855381 [Trichonephila clavipes]
MGSALETGGWQFIDQHGHMRRLNQVNLRMSPFASQRPLDVFSHITSLGLNSLTCFASMMARLKLSNHVFFDANGLYKTEQTLVWRWALGRGYPLGLGPAEQHIQCIGFIGQRHGHHRGRKVLGEGINRVHDKALKAPLAFIRFKQDAGRKHASVTMDGMVKR